MSAQPDTMRLAIFVSGGGSNFQAILDAVARGALRAEVVLCVSNRQRAHGLERARRCGVPQLVLDPSTFTREETYESTLLAELAAERVTFIALAGYLRRIPPGVVATFRNRMLNVHPALLPAHGGKGLFGRRVHESVLAAGDAESGATVHMVSEEYDTGPIVLQERVPVLDGDTPESLAARVLEVEHRLYPRALRLFANRLVTVRGDTVCITDRSR